MFSGSKSRSYKIFVQFLTFTVSLTTILISIPLQPGSTISRAQALEGEDIISVQYNYTDTSKKSFVVVVGTRDRAGDLGETSTVSETGFPGAPLILGETTGGLQQSARPNEKYYSGNISLSGKSVPMLISVQGDKVTGLYMQVPYCQNGVDLVINGNCSNRQTGWLHTDGKFKIAYRVGVLGNAKAAPRTAAFGSAGTVPSAPHMEMMGLIAGTKAESGQYTGQISGGVDDGRNTDIDAIKNRLGSNLCQAFQALKTLNMDFAEEDNKYWDKDSIPSGESPSVVGKLVSPVATVQDVIVTYNMYTDGGMDAGLNREGKALLNEAKQSMERVKEDYAKLQQLAAEGKIDPNNLNIDSCNFGGTRVDINELGDPENPTPGSLANLVKQGDKITGMVENLPTSYAAGECGCGASSVWKDGFMKVLQEVFCNIICFISTMLGSFACLILEWIIVPLFHPPTGSTCNLNAAIEGNTAKPNSSGNSGDSSTPAPWVPSGSPSATPSSKPAPETPVPVPDAPVAA